MLSVLQGLSSCILVRRTSVLPGSEHAQPILVTTGFTQQMADSLTNISPIVLPLECYMHCSSQDCGVRVRVMESEGILGGIGVGKNVPTLTPTSI
jgi:hypothetical protein